MTAPLLSERLYKQLTMMCSDYADRINALLDDEEDRLTKFQLEKLFDLLKLVSQLDVYLDNIRLFQKNKKTRQAMQTTITVGVLLDILMCDEEKLKQSNIYLEVH